MTTSLAERIDGLLADEERATRLVAEYFRDGTAATWTGRWFDRIGRDYSGADRSPFQLTADDIVAASTLSVDIPAEAAAELLISSQAEITALLEAIPVDIDIFSPIARDHLSDGAPADRLWRHLDGIRGIGWVTAHKLLAHKRPRLLPVYDNVVKAILSPDDQAFWVPLHEALTGDAGEGRVGALRAIRTAADLTTPITELRVLDVIAWRAGTA